MLTRRLSLLKHWMVLYPWRIDHPSFPEFLFFVFGINSTFFLSLLNSEAFCILWQGVLFLQRLCLGPWQLHPVPRRPLLGLWWPPPAFFWKWSSPFGVRLPHYNRGYLYDLSYSVISGLTPSRDRFWGLPSPFGYPRGHKPASWQPSWVPAGVVELQLLDSTGATS